MIIYIVSFLLGICSLQFFPKVPDLTTSLIIYVIVFLSVLLVQMIFYKNFFIPHGMVNNPRNKNFYWLYKVNKLNKLINNLFKVLFWIVIAFIFGYFWMWFHIQANLARRLPENLVAEPIQVIGTIKSIPEFKEGGVRFEFEIKNTIPHNLWKNPGNVLLSYYEPRKTNKKYGQGSHTKEKAKDTVKFNPAELKVGDEWQFWVKLKHPRSYSNPGSFDKEKYFFQNRLQAQGTILLKKSKHPSQKKINKQIIASGINETTAEINNNSNGSHHNINTPDAKFEKSLNTVDFNPKKLNSHWYSCPIQRLRAMLLAKMKLSLENKKFGPLIVALILGVRENITEAQWAIFRDTGTAHLMAISGLHIGLIAGVVYFFSQIIWRFLPLSCLIVPAPVIAAISAILAAGFYALLAGFSIPTQRAMVMIVLFMSNILRRQSSHTWQNYFLALAFVLLLDPFCTLSLGFWLSFAAVALMLYGLKGRLQVKSWWWKWGRAQWVVFLGLLPLCLAFFKQASLISPLANIIAIPWVSFTIVPLSLFGTIALLLSEALGKLLLTLADGSFHLLFPLLNFFSELPQANWKPAEATTIALIFAFMGCLILLTPKGFPGRLSGIIWLCPLLLAKPMQIPQGIAKFTLLDVGQGLASVLQTEKHVLIFDTGPKQGQNFSAGAKVILPFLASQGIKKIDTVIISHGDNDHLGGLEAILNNMPVEKIFTSEVDTVKRVNSIKNYPAPTHIQACYAGQHWNWDGVDFEMLHPDTLQTAKRNDHCCVLKVSTQKQGLLLTGDIELPSENKLVERSKNKLPATFLIVPHHGSKTSSSEDFIAAVHPSYALIPVGYLNPYGHPKTEILSRYQKLHIPVFDNIQAGALSLMLTNKDIIQTPESYRAEKQHFWQWNF